MKKNHKEKKNNPLNFKGMSFEEALTDLLKVKPEAKPKNKKETKKPFDESLKTILSIPPEKKIMDDPPKPG